MICSGYFSTYWEESNARINSCIQLRNPFCTHKHHLTVMSVSHSKLLLLVSLMRKPLRITLYQSVKLKTKL
jgi:hypothetical protein